jgi:pimeloyl-ACP methyl ester carboxylesterase
MSLRLVLVIIALFFSPLARADALVLVHGYLGDAGSWESKGVTSVLAAHGWANGGRLTIGTRGFDKASEPPRGRHGTLYAVNLPSTAPLMVQSDILWALMNKIFDRHPDEPVIMAGHSAGGVVARLALVRFGPGAVSTLITLASPHLGTPRALDGLDVIQDSGPFELVKEWVGGSDYRKAKHSGPALWDLSPPGPGSLLYWLNGQDHPDIRYVSVLRLPDRDGGDDVVPVFSQDMNQIAPLRGKAEIVRTFGDHYLRRGDGAVIAGLTGS